MTFGEKVKAERTKLGKPDCSESGYADCTGLSTSQTGTPKRFS